MARNNSRGSAIRRLYLATLAGLMAAIWPSLAAADQVACLGYFDGVRTTKNLHVALDKRDEFLVFLRQVGHDMDLHYSSVHNSEHYDTILQVDPTIAIIVENDNPKALFRARLETCNAKVSWQPTWDGFLERVYKFPFGVN